VRPRELWFWLGAAFLTIGAVLTAIAIAYFTKETHYSLSTGPQMIAAYAAFISAFLCFFAAIAGWRPWLRWQRFPNLVVRVDGIGNEVGSKQIPGFPVMPTSIMTLKVHITNAEVDRNVSIRTAYLLAKSRPEFPLHEQLFSAPSDPVSYTPLDRAFDFPVNLAPQASEGGGLVFELRDFQMVHVAQPFEARVEIHDSVSGKMACFPANLGTFWRHHGLRPTTYAERVNRPKAPQPWYGLMGPPDRDSDMMKRPDSDKH
jgi:hypothetical protein